MKHCFILFSLLTTMAVAQTPSITVIGQGVVHVTPDVVNISVSIVNEGDNPKNLRERNAAMVAKVLQVLNKEKLPKNAYKTNYISLHKNYNYDYKDNNDKNPSYLISQQIEIRLEDLTKYETLMEKIFEAGVNNINEVSFDVKDRSKYTQEARLLAVNNAKTKATLYASALNQTIGKAIQIKEGTAYSIMSNANVQIRGVAPESKPSIAEGSMDVRAEITIDFELK